MGAVELKASSPGRHVADRSSVARPPWRRSSSAAGTSRMGQRPRARRTASPRIDSARCRSGPRPVRAGQDHARQACEQGDTEGAQTVVIGCPCRRSVETESTGLDAPRTARGPSVQPGDRCSGDRRRAPTPSAAGARAMNPSTITSAATPSTTTHPSGCGQTRPRIDERMHVRAWSTAGQAVHGFRPRPVCVRPASHARLLAT